MPVLVCGFWDLNSGPCGYAASTVTTEPFLHPAKIHLYAVVSCISNCGFVLSGEMVCVGFSSSVFFFNAFGCSGSFKTFTQLVPYKSHLDIVWAWIKSLDILGSTTKVPIYNRAFIFIYLLFTWLSLEFSACLISFDVYIFAFFR